MKFLMLATLGLGLASAAPSALQHQEKEERSLDKRLGPFGLAVLGGVAAAVTGKVIEAFQGSSKRSEQTWDSVSASCSKLVLQIALADTCNSAS